MHLTEGFVAGDVWPIIKVDGDPGMRADRLRIAWSSGYEKNGGLDWLLFRVDYCTGFPDSHFAPIARPDDYGASHRSC